MSVLFSLLCCLLFCLSAISQNFYSDFEDGTLQGWTNTNGSTDFLTVIPNGTSGGYHLQKNVDGSNSPLGEMAIKNTENWVGNYFYSPTGSGDQDMKSVDEIILRNSNSFNLNLRFAYKGSNGYMVVTTDPIVVPAQSDWAVYTSEHYIDFPVIHNLTILNDTGGLPYAEVFNNVHEMFEDVVEFRILHNNEIAFDGSIETGTLEIDDIYFYELLSVEDPSIDSIKLFPNPVKDMLSISTKNDILKEIEIFNVLGEKVFYSKLSSKTTKLDLSILKSGVYFATIKTERSNITKKIIKI